MLLELHVWLKHNVPVPGPVRPIRTRPARASYGRAVAAARREIVQTTE